jgi:hypothetical protein
MRAWNQVILLSLCGTILIGGSNGSAIIGDGSSDPIHDAELIEKFQKETGVRDPKCEHFKKIL